jgi:hypothetical protein
MMTPSSVRMLRILLAHSESSASLKASLSGMASRSYDTHPLGAQFRPGPVIVRRDSWIVDRGS